MKADESLNRKRIVIDLLHRLHSMCRDSCSCTQASYAQQSHLTPPHWKLPASCASDLAGIYFLVVLLDMR